MRKLTRLFLSALLVPGSLAVGMQSKTAPHPEPPFAIEKPEEPPATYKERNLKEAPAQILRSSAQTAVSNGDLGGAIQFQHWAVAAEPGRGVYDLACFYAASGQHDASIYWLQRATLEEGVDVDWVPRDPDLKTLRKDARWQTLVSFLKDSNEYWAKSKHRREVVSLPANYKTGEPIPVLLGLHGRGSRPEDFAGSAEDQELANQLNLALVSLSATIPHGPNSFSWAKDLEENRRHIAAGLDRVKGRLTLKKGWLIAIGFSQGAQLAAELAGRDPQSYAGAIVLCPGGEFEDRANAARPKKSQTLVRRAFVVISGGKEHPGNLRLAREDAQWLKGAGALVVHHVYEDIGHRFPPYFDDNLAIWTQFILGFREQPRN